MFLNGEKRKTREETSLFLRDLRRVPVREKGFAREREEGKNPLLLISLTTVSSLKSSSLDQRRPWFSFT